MWGDPATQANCDLLRKRNIRFIGPDSGSQACGDVGMGRMSEPADIVSRLLSGGEPGLFAGLNILITAGPTRESIDPVRFVSNRSSGKMGFALARAAADAGARVTLISGPVNLPTPPAVERIDVESTQQMFDSTMQRISGMDIYIGAAAISDYRPKTAVAQKIKKSADTFTLEMVKSPDLLASIAALTDGPFTVGFAAETEKLEQYAADKLNRKKLDMIVANLVGEKICFDADENEVVVLWQDGRRQISRTSKSELARILVDVIAGLYKQARHRA
jgi:phosphopantothenoylcysteine decarboxylase/phosphopantothenate--cysteine ligase